MSIQQLNNLNLKAGLEADGDVGSAGQVLSSTGPNGIEWINQSTLSSGSAERTEILVKNLEGSALSKGDPVYIIGSVGASERLKVGLANAGDAAKMPCVGLLTQDLAINGEGTAIVTGKLKNLITSPIDGATPTENDTIYVKSGGGLTLTKPTGSTNLIQNVGQIGRVSTSSDGNIVVSAILRSNDVPNLPTGRIWVGDGNTTTSGVVYLNETTNQLGINTTTTDGTVSIESPVGAGFGLFAKTAGINNWSGLYQDGSSNWTSVLRNGSGTQTVQLNSSGDSYLNGGNVGIGTTSPNEKLTVAGQIQVTDSGAQARLNLNNTGTGDSQINFQLLGSSKFTLGVDNSDSDKFKISGSSVLGSNDRLVIDSSGNVGIGTTSPQAKTRVFNSLNQDGLVVENSSASFLYSAIFANNTSTTNGNLLRLRSSGSDKMLVLGNGNVGIGTTTPQYKLDVNGDTRVTGAYYDSSNAPGTSGQILSSTATGTNWISGDERYFRRFYGTATGVSNAGFTTAFTVNGSNLASSIRMSVQGTTTGIVVSNLVDILVNHYQDIMIKSLSGVFTKLTLKVVSNNNENFAVELKTNSGSAVNLSIEVLCYGAETVTFTNSHSYTGATLEKELPYGEYISGTGGNNGDSIVDGNVGIGTTSPVNKLNVNGDIGYIGVIGQGSIYGNTGNSSYATMQLYNPSTGYSTFNNQSYGYYFNTSGGTKLTILNNGNVGIGTTSPSAKLDVVGKVKASGLDIDGTGNADTTFITYTRTDLTQPASIIYDGTGGFKFNANGLIYSFTDNTGLGIGTSSPDSKLQISGSGTQRLRVTSTDGANADLSCDGVSSMTLGSPNGIPIRFVTSNAERMRITSSGNVGIGTTAPNRDLVVSDATNAHLKILSYTAVAEAQLTFATISSNTLYEKSAIIASGSGSWGRHNMHFCVNNAASSANVTLSDSRMMIDYATGNVGIGTTSPDTKLHIVDNDCYITLEDNNTNSPTYYQSGVIFRENRSKIQFRNDPGFQGFVISAGVSSYTDRLYLKEFNGYLGIGTSPSYQLQLSLNSAAKPSSIYWTTTSDERVKTNIRQYEKSLEHVVQLNPKLYDYNGKAGFDPNSVDNIGFIAQDIVDIFPEAVKTYKAKLEETDEKETELYNIDFQAITFAMINSIKELNNKIEQLETRIQTLENN